MKFLGQERYGDRICGSEYSKKKKNPLRRDLFRLMFDEYLGQMSKKMEDIFIIDLPQFRYIFTYTEKSEITIHNIRKYPNKISLCMFKIT